MSTFVCLIDRLPSSRCTSLLLPEAVSTCIAGMLSGTQRCTHVCTALWLVRWWRADSLFFLVIFFSIYFILKKQTNNNKNRYLRAHNRTLYLLHLIASVMLLLLAMFEHPYGISIKVPVKNSTQSNGHSYEKVRLELDIWYVHVWKSSTSTSLWCVYEVPVYESLRLAYLQTN